MMYKCIHSRKCVIQYAYISISACMYVHARTYVCTHVSVCVPVDMYSHRCKVHIYMCKNACMHICICLCVHASMCGYVCRGAWLWIHLMYACMCMIFYVCFVHHPPLTSAAKPTSAATGGRCSRYLLVRVSCCWVHGVRHAVAPCWACTDFRPQSWCRWSDPRRNRHPERPSSPVVSTRGDLHRVSTMGYPWLSPGHNGSADKTPQMPLGMRYIITTNEGCVKSRCQCSILCLVAVGAPPRNYSASSSWKGSLK